MSAQTYQVGAHFAALIEGILMAPLKTIERVFCISSSPAGLWGHSVVKFQSWALFTNFKSKNWNEVGRDLREDCYE